MSSGHLKTFFFCFSSFIASGHLKTDFSHPFGEGTPYLFVPQLPNDLEVILSVEKRHGHEHWTIMLIETSTHAIVVALESHFTDSRNHYVMTSKVPATAKISNYLFSYGIPSSPSLHKFMYNFISFWPEFLFFPAFCKLNFNYNLFVYNFNVSIMIYFGWRALKIIYYSCMTSIWNLWDSNFLRLKAINSKNVIRFYYLTQEVVNDLLLYYQIFKVNT